MRRRLHQLHQLVQFNQFHLFPLIALLIASLTSLSGCRNFLSESADRTAPAAIIFEAKKLLNDQLYTEAITLLETLPDADLAERDVVSLRASAYAGRCGLNFISFVSQLQDMEDGTTLLQLFLDVMKAATAPADCITAEDLVETIGATGAERTEDENLFMAFVSFAKIGATLAATGNADEDDDGAPDAGFNACTALTRADGAEIGTGIAIAIDSLANADADLFSDALDDMEAICTALGTCATDPADYDDSERDAIRTVVHDDDGSFGLGTQNPQGDPTKICNAEGA